MKPILPEEAKKLEFEILCAVADFCEENGLCYFIAYGTLIGALRHKGFIPWDDDVDLQMPRADYDRFIKTFTHPYLQVVSPLSPVARHSIAKVIDPRTVKLEKGTDYRNGTLGIDVDIFPIDGAPASDEEFEKFYTTLHKLYEKSIFAGQTLFGSWKRKLFMLLSKPFTKKREHYILRAAELHKKFPYDECEMVGTFETCVNGRGNRVPKACFASHVMLPFEGREFRAPVGYDAILTNIYGDYMTPPPAEKQVTHHENTAFWKDEQ